MDEKLATTVGEVHDYWNTHTLGFQYVTDKSIKPGTREFFAHIRPWMNPYKFPWIMERIERVDAYGGDDDASMAANNTSAFNCRAVTGGSTLSQHSFGTALDINPVQNPYVNGGTVLPPSGSSYQDRSNYQPGMVLSGSIALEAFEDIGWIWGGNWSSLKDYQHFSVSGK